MVRRQRTTRMELIRNLVAIGFVAAATAAGTIASRPESVPGGDWPTYRHDAALSAVSPLKGGLGHAPRVAWSVDLGGPRVPSETVLVRDVTGDGRDEILILGGDSVECRDASGRRLWMLEGYPKPSVVDIRDYAGDGSRGLLLSTTRGGRVEVFMVDGRSGRSIPLWMDENNFGGHTRFGKLLTGVAGRKSPAPPAGKPHRHHTGEVSGWSASRTASIDPTSASVSPCPATSTLRSCSSTTSMPTAPWRWS